MSDIFTNSSMTAFVEAVQAALVTAEQFTSRSSLMPDVTKIPTDAVKLYSTPTPRQWAIQASEFRENLAAKYDEIGRGETVVVIAATGIGKTTVMPVAFANHTGKAGIVLYPNRQALAMNMKYIVDLYKDTKDLFVGPLRSAHVVSPPSKRAVYYSYAPDFLIRLQRDRDMLVKLGIDFVYMDESHDWVPAYKFMKLIRDVPFMKTVKTFYGTATQKGVSLIVTGNHPDSESVPRDSSEFNLNDPDSTSPNSVMHYSQVKLHERSMIFLPNDACIHDWFTYYEKYDIRVFCYFTYTKDRELLEMRDEAFKVNSFVWLTWERLQSSVTLPISVVISTGMTIEQDVNYYDKTVKFVKVGVTKENRTQQLGRVNRFSRGAAYYNDIPAAKTQTDLTDGDSVYVAIWCKLFGFVANDPVIRKFDALFDECSGELLCLLACSRVHPYLIMPYLTTQGHLFDSVKMAAQVFSTDTPIPVNYDEELNTSKWSVFSTGPVSWLDEPMEYKSMVEFPDELVAIPAALWFNYRSGKDNFRLASDNRSVITALNTVKKKASTVNRNASTLTVHRRPLSVVTNNRTPYIQFDSQFVPELPPVAERAGSPISSLRFKPIQESVPKPSRSVMSDETIEMDRVDNWRREVEVIEPRRHRRKKSSSSSSSDRDVIKLRKVDPYNYRTFKLYPIDPGFLKTFLACEAAVDGDFRNFHQLMRAERGDVFASLHSDPSENVVKQVEYFLSVLRVHNYYLALGLQKRASAGKMSLVDKFLGRPEDNTTEKVIATAKLLLAMGLERYFVGIDSRSNHSLRSATVSRSQDMTKFQRMEFLAKYFLESCDPSIEVSVGILKGCCVPVYSGIEIIGTSWHFWEYLLMPQHVAEQFGEQMTQVLVLDEVNDYAITIAGQDNLVSINFREPVHQEPVLLIGYDNSKFERIALGVVNVFSYENLWLLSCSLRQGYSGFLVVSVTDAAVLGMYLGAYDLDGVSNVGRFVSADKFIAHFARFI